MTKYVYGAVIRESETGEWWAEIPDLPGCFGQGSSFMEAVSSISDALETHLASLVDYGLVPPEPRAVEADDGRVVYVYANTDGATLGEPEVSAAEAARMLGVSPGRVSQLIAEGKLRALRSAVGTTVALASIEAYQKNRRTPGRPRKTALEA